MGRPLNNRTSRIVRLCFYSAGLTACIVGILIVSRQQPFSPDAAIPEVDLTQVHADVADGIRRAVQVIQERPESGLAWGHLGMTLWAHEYSRESLVCFEQAEKHSPDELRWPYFRGVILSTSDRSAALEAFSRAAKIDPVHPAPLIRKCELLLEAGELDAAREVLTRLLKQSPDNAQVYLLAAFHADRRGDSEEAIRYARRSLALAPGHVKVVSLLARLLNRAGQNDEATALNERLRSLAVTDDGWPDPLVSEVSSFRLDPYWNAYRANQMIQSGGEQNGLSLLRSLLNQFPDEPAIRIQLVRALLNRGRIDDAAEVLREAEDSSHFELRMLMATTSLLSEDWSRAEAIYRELLDRKSDSPSMLSEFAFCLRQQLRSSEGLAPAKRAVRLAPEQVSFRLELVRILIDLDRMAEASRELSVLEAIDSNGVSNSESEQIQELRGQIGESSHGRMRNERNVNRPERES